MRGLLISSQSTSPPGVGGRTWVSPEIRVELALEAAIEADGVEESFLATPNSCG